MFFRKYPVRSLLFARVMHYNSMLINKSCYLPVLADRTIKRKSKGP